MLLPGDSNSGGEHWPFNIHERRNTKANSKLLRSHCISNFIAKIFNWHRIVFIDGERKRSESTMKDEGNRKINFSCEKCSQIFMLRMKWITNKKKCLCDFVGFFEKNRACACEHAHMHSWLDWLNFCDTQTRQEVVEKHIYSNVQFWFRCLLFEFFFSFAVHIFNILVGETRQTSTAQLNRCGTRIYVGLSPLNVSGDRYKHRA